MPNDNHETDAVYSALRHRSRREILALLWRAERPLSPAEIADILNQPLSEASYHVKNLTEECGLLALADQVPVRGSIKHLYVMSDSARESREIRSAVEAIDVPLPLPEPRQPPTEITFGLYADHVLAADEKSIVEYRRGWNGRPQRSRKEVAEMFKAGLERIRQIERGALYKIERAKFEDDRVND